MMARPRGTPNSAKDSRRPPRTATEPSSRGRSTSLIRGFSHASRTPEGAHHPRLRPRDDSWSRAGRARPRTMVPMEWLLLAISVGLVLACGVFGAAEYSFVAIDRSAVEKAASE